MSFGGFSAKNKLNLYTRQSLSLPFFISSPRASQINFASVEIVTDNCRFFQDCLFSSLEGIFINFPKKVFLDAPSLFNP